MAPKSRVRVRREALGMTQADLGRAVGRTRMWVQGVERGRGAGPQRADMLLLAGALGVPAAELWPELDAGR